MRVVVAEDQALLREGLARLFQDAGHDVVGLATDGGSVRDVVAEQQPDLVVVDIRMPPTFTDEASRPRTGSATTIRGSACWCCRSTSMPPVSST